MRAAVTMVIPCYNEASRLEVDKFKAYVDAGRPHRFVFVNDGSRDQTLEVVEDLHRNRPQSFTYIDLPKNVGKAEAVRQGVLSTFDTQADLAGYWDADLATPLDAIPAFCELLESRPDLEMVFGARVRLLGRSIVRNPLRHYLGRAFATAASLTLGLPIYDTQCGAKLFRVSPLIRSLFQQPFMTRWLFDVEIIARLIQTCRRDHLQPPQELIYEFPLHTWHDVAGSKVKALDFFTSFLELARIYWKYLR
ncbi:MAG TPA: glycosyltransferase [Candidatus Tectomicrobia bacterium]|nr:glycosyltransferase [Candidatus Tectomicrobia bacterium]